MNPIIGAIFPISKEHASRIFDEQKKVFVKFTNLNKLTRNSKIIFYVTKKKNLIGEGIIHKTDRMAPEIAWSHYFKDIFLNEADYNDYISWSPITKRKRRSSEITVFVLRDLIKYDTIIFSSRRIAASGQYIRNEEYDRIRARSSLKTAK